MDGYQGAPNIITMEGKTLPNPQLQQEWNNLVKQLELLQEQMTATPESQEPQQPKKARKHGHPRQLWEDVEPLVFTMIAMYTATHDLSLAFLLDEDLDKSFFAKIGNQNERAMRTTEAMYSAAPVLINCHKDNIERTSIMDAMICVLPALQGELVTAEVVNILQHMGSTGKSLSLHLFDVPLVALLRPDTPEKQNTHRKRALGMIEKRIKALEEAGILMGRLEKRAAEITNPWAKRNPLVASWCVAADFWEDMIEDSEDPMEPITAQQNLPF